MTAHDEAHRSLKIGFAMSLIMTTYGMLGGYASTVIWGPKGVLISSLSGLIVGTGLQIVMFRLVR